jgi:hypothetical protein
LKIHEWMAADQLVHHRRFRIRNLTFFGTWLMTRRPSKLREAKVLEPRIKQIELVAVILGTWREGYFFVNIFATNW